MVNLIARFAAGARDERAQTLVEYAFILMLVATLTVAALAAIGGWVPGPLTEVADALT